MAATLTSIRPGTHLVHEAAKVLGVKSRTKAVNVALREIVGLKRFKGLMRKYARKLSFAGDREGRNLALSRLGKRQPTLTSRQVRKALGLDD